MVLANSLHVGKATFSAYEVPLSNAYMSGLHSIFTMYTPISGVCFVDASLAKDCGLEEKDSSATGMVES